MKRKHKRRSLLWAFRMAYEHTSVMPCEVHEHQNLRPGSVCVDCTLGGAGHAQATLQSILPDGRLIGIDQDLDAITNAKKVLAPYKNNILINHSNFSQLPDILETHHILGVDSILLDLGYSLHQIRNSNRGFSFNSEEPLDMRMDIRNQLTAADIVNSFKENELVNLFFKYGEEKFSRKIATHIVKERSKAPVTTSLKLAQLVSDAVPKKAAHKQKIHPATRVFQALRIAVNSELDRLEMFLKEAPQMLNKGGRLLVISFHSLEDRITKQAIRKFEDGCTCPKDLPVCLCGFKPSMKSVFRKPLTAGPEEIEKNPMARSAKLRVAERI